MAKTTATTYGISSDLQTATHCQHCGEEIVISNTFESKGNYFCCNGCIAVYELLNTLGLDNFYKIKDEQNIEKIGRPIDPDSNEQYAHLDQENFISQYVNTDFPNEMKFYIEGIHCGACLWLIEKIPDYLQDVDSVSLNMSSNIATVNFNENRRFSSFPEMVGKLGYKAHPVRMDEEAKALRNKENRQSLIRLSVAAVCAGNIMLLSAAIYSGAQGVFKEHFELINLIFSLPVVTYCSLPFYKSIMSSLRSRRVTVDIPIGFVILVGFLLSAYNLYIGNDKVYFDSVTAFVFLLLASRYFLKSVQERISNKRPASSSLFSENKVLVWDQQNRQFFLEPTQDLKAGQKVKVRKAERIPIDGRLLSKNAELNLSVLTGENIPQSVIQNDNVYAGSILESEEATIEITNVASSTRIGRLLDEVEKNYQGKISFSTYSDKFATTFTLLVAIIAIVSFLIITTLINPSAALNRVMAFVLIACPCAFVFALPLSLGLSLKEAMHKGILVKNSNTFEKLSQVRNIFFDKTGTLTKGVYRILKWDTEKLSEYDRAAICAIERLSNHPIARAIVSQLYKNNMELPEVRELKSIPTKGIQANVGNHLYEFVSDRNINSSNEINEIITTKIIINKDGNTISELFLGDSLKEDAKYVVNLLMDRGYRVHILSGDNRNNVRQAASKLGIHKNNIYWEKTPEEKSLILKQSNHSMMIGDGLNDTAAFASADVGVSVQGSVEESLRVSDAYILHNDLSSAAVLLSNALSTKKTLKRNTLFSIAYNASAGTFALLGYIDPLAAAVLMPLSSLLLIGSSLYGHGDINLRRQREAL